MMTFRALTQAIYFNSWEVTLKTQRHDTGQIQHDSNCVGNDSLHPSYTPKYHEHSKHSVCGKAYEVFIELAAGSVRSPDSSKPQVCFILLGLFFW